MTSNSGTCRHELPRFAGPALILSLAVACTPPSDLAVSNTSTPSTPPTLTAASSPPHTETPIPTSTMAPSPTAVPTLGNLLFRDDFSRDRGWDLGQSPGGAISLLDQRLVIAVRGPSAVLYSLSPAPESSDFLLEVEVHSEICLPGDEFGFMARARSLQTHYRFTLTCEGAVRASRFIDGREAALTPITDSQAAIRGAPAVNRLRLEADQERFRFFVNDIQVIEVSDSQLEAGRTGLIVRARRSAQTTVSFDDFSLRSPAED